MSVKDLDCFDSTNFQLALSVIGYRRTAGWSDNDFWQLALYAKGRLGR